MRIEYPIPAQKKEDMIMNQKQLAQFTKVLGEYVKHFSEQANGSHDSKDFGIAIGVKIALDLMEAHTKIINRANSPEESA